MSSGFRAASMAATPAHRVLCSALSWFCQPVQAAACGTLPRNQDPFLFTDSHAWTCTQAGHCPIYARDGPTELSPNANSAVLLCMARLPQPLACGSVLRQRRQQRQCGLAGLAVGARQQRRQRLGHAQVARSRCVLRPLTQDLVVCVFQVNVFDPLSVKHCLCTCHRCAAPWHCMHWMQSRQQHRLGKR